MKTTLIFFLLACLVILSVKGQYQIQTVYNTGGCTGQVGFMNATLVSNCTAQPCICVGPTCCVTTCSQTVPSFPSNTGGYYYYSDPGCSNIVGVTASLCGACVPTGTSTTASSYLLTCYQTKYTTQVQINYCSISENARFITYSARYCLSANVGSTFVKAYCPQCFHESSTITYEDKSFDFKALQAKKNPKCTIPHVVTADGVKISTTCSSKALRLTNDHLVFTNRGLLKAQEITEGDLLFGDVEENKECAVVEIEREKQQKYFGLNCEESVVLANGHKTSTFGGFHTLPSLWMRYGSKIIGVEAASYVGERVVQFLYQWNILQLFTY